MLSKNSRRVLNHAKAQDKKTALYEDLMSAYDWSYAEARSACLHLIESGYAIEKATYTVDRVRDVIGITLTEKGINSVRWFWADAGEYFFKSVVIPIIVAFITALLTALYVK